MSPPETLGFAILGTGMVADYHHQAITANAESGARLVTMGHYDPARFATIGEKFGVPCVGQDDLLADPAVDVVCICTPSGQHAAQTIAAAHAGKHVLVEKPMALNLPDADAMISACQQAGVSLGIVLQRRAAPLFQRIHHAIQAGDLGDLTLCVVTMPYYRPQAYFDQADWRGTWALDGGGVLMSQGIHLVDLLVWYMGDPVEVQAHARTLHRDIEVEDTLATALRFTNGSLATITATTTAAGGFPHRLEVYGTNGGIRTEGDVLTGWQIADPDRATVEAPPAGHAPDAGAGGDPRGISADDHIALFRDFIHALREGHAPCVDGPEGRRSLSAVLAIYRAAGLLD
jgi:UDP-N-acetyl-2-amino-2-deoxyglucuronate dehydrogenase